MHNVKEVTVQRLSVGLVVSGPLARSMSRTPPYRHFVDQLKLWLHRSGTWLDPNNLTPSVQLTVGYTQAKLFLCSPGIALEKYKFLSLYFFPRLRHMHGRPVFLIQLLAGGMRKNPRSGMMKRDGRGA